MGWFNNDSDFRIYSEAGGSGTTRSISFFIGSTNKLELTGTWIDLRGSCRPDTNGTRHFGYSTNRWGIGWFDQLDQEILTSTDVGHILKGAASQSADLAQYQNSAGTVMASIDANGNIDTTGNITATGDLTCDDITCGDITLGSHGTINPAGSTSIQMQVAGTTYLQVRAGAVQARGASLRFTDASNNSKAHIDYLDTNIIGVRDSSDANLAAFHAATGQFTQALLSSGTVDSTGLLTAATGITLQRNTPETTTDKLYNVGGVLYFNGSGVNGAGATPGGSDTQVQFNDGGSFGGDSDMTWNKTSNTLTINGSISAMAKSFLIDHPTKKDMLLKYGSLEGPENGVYVRGTTSDSTIHLPDYWTGLVDENSITVNLTPLGKFQALYVVDKNNQYVTVDGAEGEYDYIVYGTRKDVPDLEVEAEK
jgi:hypothetical protein